MKKVFLLLYAACLVAFTSSCQQEIIPVKLGSQEIVSAKPGSSVLRIGGMGCCPGSNALLYVIDGVEMYKSYAACEEELTKLDPQSIQSIAIMKSDDANRIYGEKAAHGVILITTKDAKTQRD